MTPRKLDWRSVRPKLRRIDELLETLREVGEVDAERLVDYTKVAGAVPLAIEQYGEYTRQVAGWFVDRDIAHEG